MCLELDSLSQRAHQINQRFSKVSSTSIRTTKGLRKPSQRFDVFFRKISGWGQTRLTGFRSVKLVAEQISAPARAADPDTANASEHLHKEQHGNREPHRYDKPPHDHVPDLPRHARRRIAVHQRSHRYTGAWSVNSSVANRIRKGTR